MNTHSVLSFTSLLRKSVCQGEEGKSNLIFFSFKNRNKILTWLTWAIALNTHKKEPLSQSDPSHPWRSGHTPSAREILTLKDKNKLTTRLKRLKFFPQMLLWQGAIFRWGRKVENPPHLPDTITQLIGGPPRGLKAPHNSDLSQPSSLDTVKADRA